jgi:SAM-dependent methyltransferase
MQAFRWATESIKERGIIQTAKVVASVVRDLSFDWKYGTDTGGWVPSDALDAESANQLHSVSYQPTKSRPLLLLLAKLELPKACTFLDIGAGKGRVLLIACQYGFERVVGIEFSPSLCTIARKNVETFSRKTKRRWPIDVIKADVTTYNFRNEERVFFMFNPFDAVILGQVVNNIRRSLQSDPRPIWLIYNTPIYHDVIARSGLFIRNEFYEIGCSHFRVYSNQESGGGK